ncbi:MAG TPA: glucosaminidase domain-containing protein [Ktedonobacteraceae bacterium]|nr:glucosaminidase domain-containing protein [Ktedonobacteraceae bacterium]
MARSRKSRTRKLLTRLRKLWFGSLFTRIFVAISVLLVVLVIAYAFQFTEARYYTVVGKPSISAEFINRVLALYDSPATGKGQALYDDGVEYGIDPVYALAFFMHESRFGTTGVATVTHSLGNIRATTGYAQYDGYRMYRTWEEGFADWFRLIAKLYVAQWGLSTVDQIVPVYAPGSDNNDVAAYIAAVKKAVDAWRSGSVEV